MLCVVCDIFFIYFLYIVGSLKLILWCNIYVLGFSMIYVCCVSIVLGNLSGYGGRNVILL